MLDRIGAIRGTGEDQYEGILSILAEIYVSSGILQNADVDGKTVCFTHEPGVAGEKNPEFEIRVGGEWCAVEVKTPRLIAHGRLRSSNDLQLGVRLPDADLREHNTTLPRDNPVKDYLVSANAKFEAYEQHRPGALRVLVIVWDDYCNEPIAALTSQVSGLLTPASFYRDENDTPVTFPYIDGIVIIRHQHQIIRATRCEPLVDGVYHAFQYRHEGFPPKAFIQVPDGRKLTPVMLKALNAHPLEECMGAEYQPTEMIMWFGGNT